VAFYAAVAAIAGTFIFWQQLLWVGRRLGTRAVRVGDSLAYAAMGHERNR
jgi:hypothetical protein